MPSYLQKERILLIREQDTQLNNDPNVFSLLNLEDAVRSQSYKSGVLKEMDATPHRHSSLGRKATMDHGHPKSVVVA